MRTRLLHPLVERRHERRRHAARGFPVADPAPRAARDPAVERVREAGGPVDRACYTCACGYLFQAAVSTTVTCPHCGADQAW